PYSNSRSADRVPIGKPEIIRNAPVARLRAFYDTWYRPERMALIAVGDMSPQALETAIREIFSPLKARATAASPPDGSVPLYRETRMNITSDPEVTSSSVQLLRKRPADSDQLIADYRRSIVENLFTRMFNDRLNEITRKPDAKFLR